ncbi:MAG: lipoprotein-releasing ABC transporter permease subunit [Gammaproteobacteria bacterium]|jgi:lipoprotein-releasing system permease protein|nr:lipoprotein-releasing ABC transporter permease subunit [Gammaproteobacteria bacterium]MBT5202467.1 lipoprotein-releasing ABC transporter permease subunit [Gammaproteobacteria bacterium]MBT5601891.1 lipoprotein-releasing ABC transporter permease subunit [Gammaproteobacteria bacterium]MBT6246854.1 lipoprotein-releasing ABC transporter permease subunit [Gammaproteobacteria bacterium]
MLLDWRFSIALRYSFQNGSRRLPSFNALLSLLGLSLGVAILILVLSVINGFDQAMRERVLSVVPHAVVFQDQQVMDSSLVSLVRRNASVLAVAPLLEGTGLLQSGTAIEGIQLSAIDPIAEREVSEIGSYIVKGDFADLRAGSYRIALGAGLADSLAVGIGDVVTLVLPHMRMTLAGVSPRLKRFTIAAVFETNADVDQSMVYLHLEDARRLFGADHRVGLRLRLADLFLAPEVLQQLYYMRPDAGLMGYSWTYRQGNLYDAIALQKRTMFVLLSMLIAVAAFNVMSGLVISVEEKRADIAILRTLGCTPRHIRQIFVFCGGLVGSLGVILGLTLGVVFAYLVQPLYQALDRQFELNLLQEYFVQYLPVQILPADIVYVGLSSFLICVLTGIYPATRASLIHPVEALDVD